MVMKRIVKFGIGVFLMCFCLAASAQVKVVSPHKNLIINVMRCEVQGEYCVVDMLFENVGPSDVKAQSGSDLNLNKGYDDMGNVYGTTYDNMIFMYVGDMQNNLPGFGEAFDLPSGIPVKVRAMLKNINEIATSIKRLDLTLYFNYSPWKLGKQRVRISNIPISR